MKTPEGWFFAARRAITAHYFKRGALSAVCGLAHERAHQDPTGPSRRCLHCVNALERIAKVDTSATTEQDIEQGRMRATVTVASRERFATVANRERALQLAEDLLGGRVTLHGPVPLETVVCLAQAVADYHADAEPIDVEAAYMAWCDSGGLDQALRDDAEGAEASEVAAFTAGVRAVQGPRVLVEGRTLPKCDGDHPMPECGSPQCWHRDAEVPNAESFSWGSSRMYLDDEKGEALCRVTPNLLQRVFDWARGRGIVK